MTRRSSSSALREPFRRSFPRVKKKRRLDPSLTAEGEPEGEPETTRFSKKLLSPGRILDVLKGALDHIRLRLFGKTTRKVEYRSGRRATTFVQGSRGRPVWTRRPRAFPPRDLAFLPTVKSALVRGGARFPLRILRDDLRIWVRQGRVPLTMVLVADASASTAWFLESAAQCLSILYRDAYRSRDCMGLVAIEDDQVTVLHHPTRNLRSVLGSLTRLSPSGITPLAEALERALEIFRHQQRREPVSNPLAVLLSDCHPEPVSRTAEDLMEELPYRRARQVAALYRRQRIPIVVINPGHRRFSDGTLWWGTRLAMKIATLSGGRYYGIPGGRGLAEEDTRLWSAGPSPKNLSAHTEKITGMLIDFQTQPVETFLAD